MEKELIFIYNAKSGFFNKATDFAHKIVSPKTYNCGLCAITYGSFSIHKEWSDFLSTLDISITFLYKNDFVKKFPNISTKYPAVFLKQDERMTCFLKSFDIRREKDLPGLIKLIKEKLNYLNK